MKQIPKQKHSMAEQDAREGISLFLFLIDFLYIRILAKPCKA